MASRQALSGELCSCVAGGLQRPGVEDFGGSGYVASGRHELKVQAHIRAFINDMALVLSASTSCELAS